MGVHQSPGGIYPINSRTTQYTGNEALRLILIDQRPVLSLPHLDLNPLSQL